MPGTGDSTTQKLGRGVKVVSLDGPEVEWRDADPMPGDRTPEEYGPGEFAVLFEAEEQKVVVGLWRRDFDVGALYAKAQVIEVMLEGNVEITEPDGVVHHIGPHDTLIYDDEDKGEWKQAGPIKKLCVFIERPSNDAA